MTDIFSTIFDVAGCLPCGHCGTDTALMEGGRVLGIRHYEDCPLFDPLVELNSEDLPNSACGRGSALYGSQ